MTIVSDSFHIIPVSLVKNNLGVLATFEVGDKPITRENTLLKEDRCLIPIIRRAWEGAFDAKVIEETYRSACEIIEKAKDPYWHAQPIQLMDDAKNIKQKAFSSLEGLKNIEKSYRIEAETVYLNPSQKSETANTLRRIYQTYHAIFTPKSHSVSDLVSRFSNGGGANERVAKAQRSKESRSEVSSVREFWQKKIGSDETEVVESSSNRKKKENSLILKVSKESFVDEIGREQLEIVPVEQEKQDPPKKVSVTKRRVTNILRRMAQETLDKVRARKSKESKNPYKEKSSIRTFIHEKGSTSGIVTDELKAVFKTTSSAISQRYENFESHQEQMKEGRKKEQRREKSNCFNLSMLNRIEIDKRRSDEDVSKGSNASSWNDDQDEQVLLMRREIIHNTQYRPLTRSISVYPGSVNNRIDPKDMVEVKPFTVNDNFIVKLQCIRTYTQYSYSGDEKTEDDYFSDDEDNIFRT